MSAISPARQAILASARATLDLEARAIARQIESLDENFVGLAEYLIEKPILTFVSGIGKSGLVARKIASKLACVGVRAVYLEPTDALHGELGLIREGDCVLALSKSGTTGELVALAKAAKLRGAMIASMVCRVPSPLSNLSDWTICARVEREATAVELPTTSAIAMVALGDALVVAVSDARGFTADDFSRNHPGGNLGVLLGSQVEDVMRKAPDEVAIAHADDSLQDAVVEMTRQPIGAVLVVDRDRRLVGILTDGDVRRIVKSNPERFLRSSVGECMTQQPLCCKVGTSTLEAMRMMERNARKPVYVLPVVNERQEVMGVIRMHDLNTLQLSELSAKLG